MQIPKNPRFYINLGEYIEYVYPEHLLTKEEIISTPNIEDNYFHSEDVSDLFSVVNHRTIPSGYVENNYLVHPVYADGTQLDNVISSGSEDTAFTALLGINGHGFMDPYFSGRGDITINMTPLGATSIQSLEYSGFAMSISEPEPTPDAPFVISGATPFHCGSCIRGRYYDIQSPDVSMTMTREFANTKKINTLNGGEVSNTINNSLPKWGTHTAWHIGDDSPPSRVGRRSYKLSFSALNEKDLFPANEQISPFVWDIEGLEASDYNTITFFDGVS